MIDVELSETRDELIVRLRKVRKSLNDFQRYLSKESLKLCENPNYKNIIQKNGTISLIYMFKSKEVFYDKKISRC
jgi:hypothetical protein